MAESYGNKRKRNGQEKKNGKKKVEDRSLEKEDSKVEVEYLEMRNRN